MPEPLLHVGERHVEAAPEAGVERHHGPQHLPVGGCCGGIRHDGQGRDAWKERFPFPCVVVGNSRGPAVEDDPERHRGLAQVGRERSGPRRLESGLEGDLGFGGLLLQGWEGGPRSPTAACRGAVFHAERCHGGKGVDDGSVRLTSPEPFGFRLLAGHVGEDSPDRGLEGRGIDVRLLSV